MTITVCVVATALAGLGGTVAGKAMYDAHEEVVNKQYAKQAGVVQTLIENTVIQNGEQVIVSDYEDTDSGVGNLSVIENGKTRLLDPDGEIEYLSEHVYKLTNNKPCAITGELDSIVVCRTALPDSSSDYEDQTLVYMPIAKKAQF